MRTKMRGITERALFITSIRGDKKYSPPLSYRQVLSPSFDGKNKDFFLFGKQGT
jgi:hypothetical protein